MLKPRTLHPLPSQRILYLCLILGVIAVVEYLRRSLSVPWGIWLMIGIPAVLVVRIPARRSIYEVLVHRFRLIMRTLVRRHRVKNSPAISLPPADLFACFTINIDAIPTSISGFLHSDMFEILVKYLDRFGFKAVLMSVELKRYNGQWQMRVHYTYDVADNYNIIMTKLTDQPVRLSGVSQMDRLTHELQAISYTSQRVEIAFPLPTGYVHERWNHVVDSDNSLLSSYVTQDRPGFIQSLDQCLLDPATESISLHFHLFHRQSLRMFGIVTVKQNESTIWNGSSSFFKRIISQVTGKRGKIYGLRLCTGEQVKAFYGFHPLYLISELANHHWLRLSIEVDKHRYDPEYAPSGEENFIIAQSEDSSSKRNKKFVEKR